MKKNSIYLIVILFFVSFSFSCDKEKSIKPNQNSNLLKSTEATNAKINELENYGKKLGFTLNKNSELNKENALIFKSVAQAKKFLEISRKNNDNSKLVAFLNENFKEEIEKLTSISKINENNNTNSILSCNPGWNRAAYGRVSMGMATLNINANVTNIGNGILNSISTGLTGIRLGIGYTYFSTEIIGRDNDTITLWVAGSQDYNLLLIEGIGVGLSQNVQHKVRIHCSGAVVIETHYQ